MFDKTFFTDNRAALTGRVKADFIILSASGLLQKSADTTYPFRQDSNFWYLTGTQIADALLIINIKDDTEYFVLPPRLKHRDMWEGAIDHTAIKQVSGIQNVLTAEQGTDLLKSLVPAKPKIGTIVPDTAYIPSYGMHISPVKIIFRNRLRRLFGTTSFVDIRLDLAALRQVKQPPELAAIKHAIAITLESIMELKNHIAGMTNERDIDIFLSHQFRLRGASGHAYDPIVGSGVHAATIHHETNDGPLVKKQLLLMDVGALYQGYAADISRTYAIGQPSARQQAAFDAVKATHAYAISLLKPGVIIRDYQKEVVAYQIDQLIQAGIYKQSDHAHYEKDYPHLISHFLGLDVHDAGLYDGPLQENVVITVEPGVYLPDDKIGVRIEDDILITKTGAVNLSASLPDNLLYLQ